MDNKQIEIFKSEGGSTQIEVQVDKGTVWLNQHQISDLFLTDRTPIGCHLSNIYKTKELDENSTSAKITQVRKEGKRTITRQIGIYNFRYHFMIAVSKPNEIDTMTKVIVNLINRNN